VRKALAWLFLALVCLGIAALCEQGDGELEPYKVEDVR